MKFKIKPYRRRNRHLWYKIKKLVKPLLMNKKTQIALIAVAGVLLVAAAGLYIFMWNEGAKAENNAQQILAASEVDAPSLLDNGLENYVQPDEPDVKGDYEIEKILNTELEAYSVIARLDIDSLDVHLPILSQTSDKALKVSICYFTGPEPGDEGNLVITGHNYKSGAHFGKLEEIQPGDTVLITDKSGKTFTYTVFKIEYIQPNQPERLADDTYKNELTLMTCQESGNKRLLVRCRAES